MSNTDEESVSTTDEEALSTTDEEAMSTTDEEAMLTTDEEILAGFIITVKFTNGGRQPLYVYKSQPGDYTPCYDLGSEFVGMYDYLYQLDTCWKSDMLSRFTDCKLSDIEDDYVVIVPGTMREFTIVVDHKEWECVCWHWGDDKTFCNMGKTRCPAVRAELLVRWKETLPDDCETADDSWWMRTHSFTFTESASAECMVVPPMPPW